MLDIDFIRENREIVENSIRNRGDKPVDLDKLFALYDERKGLAKEVDDINHQKKQAADSRNIEEGKRLKEVGSQKEEELKKVTTELVSILSSISNIPSADTPIGKDETENIVARSWGEKSTFSFEPKSHSVLGKELGLIDEENAAKVSGARFVYLKGDLVLMQFAIVNLLFETLTNKDKLKEIIEKNNLSVSDKPFIPVIPPVMVRPQMLNGMGRLNPVEDKFFLEKDNLFLIGSSEHSLGPLHANEIINEKDFPIRYIGYSTCFRREAGSYGKDTKGILRQHQFDKLEMESFVLSENGIQEQDFMVAIQEHIMQLLELPYQVMQVCTGDMGGPDQRQLDIEVWIPSENKYRESHSADYNGGYQARRLNIKVERQDGNKEIVHMNDATLMAMGRIMIAIIENNQNEDGSINVPTVLQKYIGKDIIKKTL